MTLSDDEISAVLAAADVDPTTTLFLSTMLGIDSNGNAVDDVRAMAEELDLEVEDLLYGLFAEDVPMFEEDTWKDLTE